MPKASPTNCAIPKNVKNEEGDGWEKREKAEAKQERWKMQYQLSHCPAKTPNTLQKLYNGEK